MKDKRIFRLALDTLKSSCVFYTIISLTVIIITAIIDGGFDVGNKYISSLSFMFCLFPFSLTLGVSYIVLRSGMSGLKRYSLHAIITCVGFFCAVILPMSISGSIGGSTALVISVLFVIIYAFYMAVRGIIINARKKKSQAVPEYRNVYGNGKK